MEYMQYPGLAPIALGKKQAELVFKHASVFNVFTGELVKADVAVQGGFITGLGDYEGEREVDCAGKTLVPGFIDAHLHLESTLVTPPELVYNALQCGTTTFIVDPHEAVNVAGEAGLDYMLASTEDVQANVYIMLPSCVPATSEEDNGCTFTAARMLPYRDHPRVLGLGEVMDYTAIVGANPEMLEKLSLFEDKVLDGHAPGLTEKELNAYALAGIRTDHECIGFAYAAMQARLGMQVHVREGSAARNLEAIVKGLVERKMDTASFSFCTDDKHIDDIRREGHISHNIKKAIALGLPAEKAYQMATINAARCYGLKRLGAIAPGRQADIVVLDDFKSVSVAEVYYKGTLVKDAPPTAAPCPPALKRTVCTAPLAEEALHLPADNAEAPLIQVIEGQIVTRRIYERLPQQDGLFLPNEVYNKAVVVERHHKTGKTGAAAIKGFSLRNGAIATSVSHDSHNLIAVGSSDRDILLALEAVKDMQGGYAVVENGAVAHTLPLPIMGLMSDAGFDKVDETLSTMVRAAHALGVPEGVDPFVTLSFIALTVIPEIRVTTRGLYDVLERRFV